jgi:hypothetical protein
MDYFAKENFEEVPIETTNLFVKFRVDNVNHFKGLERLVNLEFLDLSNNQITSFKGFPCLPNLIFLHLQDNYIRSFEHLPMLPRLMHLYLQHNQIQSFIHLPHFPMIQSLYLFKNIITSFKHLPNFSYLRSLLVHYNNIKSFQYLPNFPNIEELYIDNNQISSFEYFPQLKNLTVINFRNNNLLSYKELSIDFFKKSNIYRYFLKDCNVSDEIIEIFISKDLKEHRKAIIKNESEEDVIAGRLYELYASNISVDSNAFILFVIKYNIKYDLVRKYGNKNIDDNKDFIESVCLKYNNDTSKKILEYIRRNSKKKMENGDIVYF